MNKIKLLLRDLMISLESIGETHEELYDTVCRERMREAIHNGFLCPKQGCDLPTDFGLYSEIATKKVRDFIVEFIKAASLVADVEGMDFTSRLESFQDPSIITEVDESDYEDFFGHVPLERFDSKGNWIGIVES